MQETTLLQDAIQVGSFQFLRGFIAGQIVLLLFAIGIFHFLFLVGPFELRRRRRNRLLTREKHGEIGMENTVVEKALAFSAYRDILNSFKYNPSTAEPETCKWLNVMIAQLLVEIRASKNLHSKFMDKISETLISGKSKSEYSDILRDISVLDISLGSKYPSISWAKVNFSESGRIRLDLKIEWIDNLSVTIDGLLAINWPITLFAALPFQFCVSLTKICGVLSVELLLVGPDENDVDVDTNSSDNCNSSNSNNSRISRVQVTFLHDAQFEFNVKSLLGHKTKVKDLSKVSSLLSTILRNAIEEEIVWPNFRLFDL